MTPPCGTPEFRYLVEETLVPILTHWDLPERKDANHFTVIGWNPYNLIFLQNMSTSNVSNAADRSHSSTPVTFLPSANLTFLFGDQRCQEDLHLMIQKVSKLALFTGGATEAADIE